MSVSIARQLPAFGDRRISEQLEKVWGKVQPTSKAKAGLLAKYKAMLPSAATAPPARSARTGRFQPHLSRLPQAL